MIKYCIIFKHFALVLVFGMFWLHVGYTLRIRYDESGEWLSSELEEKAQNARSTTNCTEQRQKKRFRVENKKECRVGAEKNVAKNFNYYFGLAHKTHKLHNKGSSDAQFMPHKLEQFPKSKSTFY